MKKIILLIIITITGLIYTNYCLSCDQYTTKSSYKLSATNPTIESNPSGANFPGLRGGNQLIKYTRAFAESSQTNEYGTEITVIDGRVVAKNGSNSLIPADGYILSGHGSAKTWLNQNTIIGTLIQFDDKTNEITAITNPDSYLFAAKTMINEAQNTLESTSIENKSIDLTESIKLLNESKKYYIDATTSKKEESIEAAKLSYKSAELSFYKSIPAKTNEERGIWYRPVETNKNDVEKSLLRLKESGINTIYLETFFHGYTIYPSNVATIYHFESQNPKFINYDPLQTWIELAHKHNMKLIVWFETFYVGTGNTSPILSKRKEWANIQRVNTDKNQLQPSNIEPGAYFLDPANPKARKYIINLIIEIVKNYNIDGINLDYIRYPASLPEYFPNYYQSTWGYSYFARREFKKLFDIDPINLTPESELWHEWEEYRIQKVNLMVKEAYKAIQENKPHIPLSVVVFPNTEKAKKQKLQDWMAWVNGGYVNVLTPIILGSSPELVFQESQIIKQKVKNKAKIYIGIFGAFNNDLPLTFAKQIISARLASIDGINIFDAAHLNNQYIQALKEGPFKVVSEN